MILEKDVEQIVLKETSNQTLISDAGGGEEEKGRRVTSTHV